MNLDDIQEELEILNEVKGDPILATRFDFTFNNNYYVLNIELDEKGEILKCNEAI